jgi:hypothetical protein
MTIQIIKVTILSDPETGQPASRTADFIIASGGPFYRWSRGGLPLVGNVQTMLEAEEAQLWQEASASGRLATKYDISLADARAWYVANPGAKAAVFDKTVDQLNTDITNLINASFPSLGATAKTAWVHTLMSGLLSTRAYTFERDLF